MPRLDDLLAIALKAGEDILSVYAQDFSVAFKDDASPVTEADTRAEAIILEGLARIAPDIPVVAEECVAAGIVPPPSLRFFLVDPLDGSKEFISRNGEFTVNIALIENGAPVEGIVYAPALGRIWWGAVGEGAFSASVEGDTIGPAQPLAVISCGDNAMRVVGSRSHKTPELDDYLGTVAVADFLAAGSSLKFCLVAEGKADLYPRFGRTMEWDTAAGDAVLRAAGGCVRTLDGALLTYGKRNLPHDSDFANPHFIACADTAPGLAKLVKN